MTPSLAHRMRIEAHAVWLAVRDPRAPWPARAVGLLVAAYALSPIDPTAAARPVSRGGIALVAAVWLAALVLLWWTVRTWWD